MEDKKYMKWTYNDKLSLLALRKNELSYHEIAKRLNRSPEACRKRYNKMVKDEADKKEYQHHLDVLESMDIISKRLVTPEPVLPPEPAKMPDVFKSMGITYKPFDTPITILPPEPVHVVPSELEPKKTGLSRLIERIFRKDK